VAALPALIQSVKAQGLEGLVAKRRDSMYEAGQRSGAWQKMRINRGQEFVIGGYTPSGKTFDALIFGYYDGDRLIYAARTRNGFTPAAGSHLGSSHRPRDQQATRASRSSKSAGIGCAMGSIWSWTSGGAEMTDIPGGSTGLSARDYEGKEADRLVTRKFNGHRSKPCSRKSVVECYVFVLRPAPRPSA
jgi:hypothetical protein